MTGRLCRLLTLAALGAASCRSASSEHAAPPDAQPLIESEHVLARAHVRCEGEYAIVDDLWVEPRGGARLTEFDLVLFSDRNHSGDPTPSERIFETRNHGDPQAGGEGFYLRCPRQPELKFQMTVATRPGGRQRGCWSVPSEPSR